jgi:O-antigen/teichoic acid export membrane protein
MRWSTALKFLRQSWPLILSGLAVTVYMKIDQVMLGAILGEEAVGQYSVAVRISSVWYFIPAMLATSLFPAILNARKQGTEVYEKRLQNYFDLNAGFAYLIAIPLSIAAPWVIRVLFGEAYQQAGPMLAIHAWSSLFVFLGVARSQYLVAENLFKFSMNCTIAGAIVNIVLNYFLIPNYGGYGAATATLFSYAISAFFSSFLIMRSHSIVWQQISSLLVPLRILKLAKNESKN